MALQTSPLVSNLTAYKTARMGLGRMGTMRMGGAPKPKYLEYRPGTSDDVLVSSQDSKHVGTGVSLYRGGGFEKESLEVDGWTTTDAVVSTTQAHTGLRSAFVSEGGTLERTIPDLQGFATYGISVWAYSVGGFVQVFLQSVPDGNYYTFAGWQPGLAAAGSALVGAAWLEVMTDPSSSGGSFVAQPGQTGVILTITCAGAPCFIDDAFVSALNNPIVRGGFYIYTRQYPPGYNPVAQPATVYTMVRE